MGKWIYLLSSISMLLGIISWAANKPTDNVVILLLMAIFGALSAQYYAQAEKPK
jgi:hypothetical protein